VRHKSLPLRAAIALTLSLAPVLAGVGATGATAAPVSRNTDALFDTTFDLGFDVSGIPHDPADVKAFILGLPSDWQLKVLTACGHFIQQPNQIKSPETYAFCMNAYSG
jgi:hypothetical protein